MKARRNKLAKQEQLRRAIRDQFMGHFKNRWAIFTADNPSGKVFSGLELRFHTLARCYQ